MVKGVRVYFPDTTSSHDYAGEYKLDVEHGALLIYGPALTPEENGGVAGNIGPLAACYAPSAWSFACYVPMRHELV